VETVDTKYFTVIETHGEGCPGIERQTEKRKTKREAISQTTSTENEGKISHAHN